MMTAHNYSRPAAYTLQENSIDNFQGLLGRLLGGSSDEPIYDEREPVIKKQHSARQKNDSPSASLPPAGYNQ